ncbi:vWA domain-containing protein [Aquibacillus rhizosphaerae]|uniref:VWA domain-containing protein n=1 Tax=Aquibacillus rhizosphaerae TaxID=3051431 RepID=A0ABT7L8E7_9BACI|nr:VWA domain-containing protein [Aquibacillus sp. LR5S19]MDL4842139.1 VWA domain-containing protein [Aquibacillus sp. LR5S19]
MRNSFRSLLTSLILIFFLVACNSNETTESKDQNNSTEETSVEKAEASVDDNEDEKEEPKVASQPQMEDVPPVPFTLEEAVNYPLVGQFSGKKFTEQEDAAKKILNQFPPLTKDSSTEEIEYGKQYLLSLFKENITMVDVPINQWESMIFGDPTGETDTLKPKENYNVALLLDASGSMANYEHDYTRMELAKEAIQQFVEDLPKTANVALYVYGHVGSGSDEDKTKSCSTIDEVYPLANYSTDEFTEALHQFDPAGWTPMAGAIKKVQEDFKELHEEQNSNVVYIVSDGVETCDEDPVKSIESLADSDINPLVNIIGYQVDNEGLVQLREMAEASDGRYVNATSQEDIITEFEQTSNMAGLWADWHNDAQRNISNLFNNISSQLSNWYNDEQEKLTRETNNLFKSIGYLKDKEIIDSDIYYEFIGMADDSSSGVRRDITDLYQELNGMNIDELWDNRKEVTNRYSNR